MDIDLVLSKIDELKHISNTYQRKKNIKASITGAVSGTLEIGGNKPIKVEGQQFTALINSEVADLAASLSELKILMENLTNEITTELTL